MTDELHELLSASIGSEPPLGSPHAAVRRRALTLRRRRRAAAGAVVGVAGLAAAVAVPALRESPRPVAAPVAPLQTPESTFAPLQTPESTAPAPPVARPLADAWPSAGPSALLITCTVDFDSSALVSGPPVDPPGGLRLTSLGAGLDARAAGKDMVEVSSADSLRVGVSVTRGALVRSVRRIVIGLDSVDGDHKFGCEVTDFDSYAVLRGPFTVSLNVDAAMVAPGTYKAVALTSYVAGPAGVPGGVVSAADAELGFYRIS